MDIKLPEITLPAFLWYILPGLTFILAAIALPMLLAKPSLLVEVSSLSGMVAIFVVALITGFLMDSLKLYRFELSYANRKSHFLSDLATQLGTTKERMEPLMDALRSTLAERDTFGRAVVFSHSRWVMLSHSAKCFYAFAGVWGCLAL